MSNLQTIIGVDGGLAGGIAFITPEDRWAIAMPTMPMTKTRRMLDIEEISSRLADTMGDGVTVALFIEALPGRFQAQMAAISANMCSGIFRGLCNGLRIGIEEVRAQEWQPAMLQAMPRGNYTERKASAIRKAVATWPKVDFRKPPSRTYHSGMCDAMLIAEYGRRKLAGA